MKRTLWIALAASLLAGAALYTYEMLVESFYESSIHLDDWPKKQYGKLDCALPVDDAKNILSQPFTYLGKGRQFFVFASDDGKYVLKFIKCQRFNVSGLSKLVTSHERLKNKQDKVDSIFASIALAATSFNAHTGVVFAHITKQSEVNCQVTLFDKLGFSHPINIDEVPFVIQKRALPVFATYKKLIETKNYDGAQVRFDELIALIRADLAAQVYDIDSGAITRDNLGFLEQQAIHVDIGTLTHASGPHLEERLSRLDPLLEWLDEQDPNLAAACRDKVREAIKGQQ